jgi:hypothetical protein
MRESTSQIGVFQQNPNHRGTLDGKRGELLNIHDTSPVVNFGFFCY